jgi:ADP-ribose pyrophosphatase YjhB (NUDIX family)
MKNPNSTPTKMIGTLVYIRRKRGDVQEIALALKGNTPKAIKRKLAGKRNAYGGGFEPDKDISIKHCAVRETREECGVIVEIQNIEHVATITFYNSWSNYECHYFVVDMNGAEPRATIEMLDPRWFAIDALPQNLMESDSLLLPRLLAKDPTQRKFLQGGIWHNDEMRVVCNTIIEVQKL